MFNLVTEEIPYCIPQDIFKKIKHLPYPFLLESSLNPPDAKFSFAGCNPYNILSEPISAQPEKCHATLRKLDNFNFQIGDKPAPFIGGAVGFISYDFGRCIETLPNSLMDDTGVPYFTFGLYSWVYAFDHANKKAFIIATGYPETEKTLYYARAYKNLSYAKYLLKTTPVEPSKEVLCKAPNIITSFTQKEYESVIQQAVNYIKAGDIFQVNISQRFRVVNPPASWKSYQHMSRINPAPFSAYFSYPNFDIVSASPERFIKKTGANILTSPIKGTRKRGSDHLEDEKMRNELWLSAKDRAELAMIIDLERNDLNKFCVPGSVQVPELYRLEKFPSVWHLVSDIYGVSENIPFSHIITNVFPGGSITGAPKIRSMEIIEELEKSRRGLYTGAIGYIGFDGDFDFNIVIRTAIYKNNVAYVQTGGGITALSDPAFEYEETLIKAQKLFDALGVTERESINF